MPAHVEREFRRYVECGILAHGFARARSPECDHDFLVALSCKRRLSVVQYPAHGRDGGAPGRSRLPAVAGVPVGVIAAEAVALFPPARYAYRHRRSEDLSAGG